MDYRIFNVRKDVNAYNCTQGRMDTVRESALKVGSGRKIPCCTGESNLCERHDGPMLYQLSYIPILMSLTRKGKCTLKYQQKHEAALEPVKKDNGSDAGTLISMNIHVDLNMPLILFGWNQKAQTDWIFDWLFRYQILHLKSKLQQGKPNFKIFRHVKAKSKNAKI